MQNFVPKKQAFFMMRLPVRHRNSGLETAQSQLCLRFEMRPNFPRQLRKLPVAPVFSSERVIPTVIDPDEGEYMPTEVGDRQWAPTPSWRARAFVISARRTDSLVTRLSRAADAVR